MTHPYQDLPSRNYWRQAVGSNDYTTFSDLWNPKFEILKSDKTITAGSCFAQHMSAAMQRAGFNWLNCEPAPEYLLPEQAKAYNYNVYSFRTSNIYTARALRQWIEWAENKGRAISDRVWEKDGRFFDPYRPTIEPGGFATREELEASRQTVLAAIRRAVRDADLFVFTMGLTEGWQNTRSKEVYAVCPGTAAGTFDAAQHRFMNQDYTDILADMEWVIQKLRKINGGLKFLFTVSPVPLVATASHQHVLPATIYSKSVLRAVAGALEQRYDFVDYFPSFEIVSAFPFKGDFFEANRRSVRPEGVNFVMSHFIGALTGEAPTELAPDPAPKAAQADMDATDTLVCEEMFLDKTS